MPVYSYRCEQCGRERIDIRCIAEKDKGPKCDRCSPRRVMDLFIETPPLGIVKDPAAGPSKRVRS